MRGQQAGNAFVSIARKIGETPAHPDVTHNPQCTLAQQRCALPRASRIGHAPLSLLRVPIISAPVAPGPPRDPPERHRDFKRIYTDERHTRMTFSLPVLCACAANCGCLKLFLRRLC